MNDRPGLGAVAVTVLLGLVVAVAVMVDVRLLVAGLVGLGLAWAGVKHPPLLVLGIFSAILFDRLGVTGAKVAKLPVTASKLAVLGSIGLWAVHALLGRRTAVKLHPVLLAMLLMTFVCGVSVANAGNFDVGRFSLIGLGMVTVLTGLVYVILAERELTWIYRVMAIVLGASMALSVVGGTHNESGRSTGTFGDPNEWATLVLLVTPVLLGGLATDRATGARLLRLGLLGLAPLSIFASGSRAALLVGAVVGLSCLVVLRNQRAELVGAGMLGLLVAPFVVDVEAAYMRFSRLLGRASGQMVTDSSLDERGELLRQGADLFMDNWFLGVGAGNYEYATGFISLEGKLRPAHNTYLEVASEQGIVGILAGLVFYGVLAATLWAAFRQAPDEGHRARVLGAATGLAASAVMAATLGLLTFSMGYLMLGLTLAVVHQSDAARPMAGRAHAA